MSKKISIIIPALSEEKRIGKTLTKLRDYLKTHLQNYDMEVLVVCADSTDKTSEIVLSFEKEFKDYSFRLLSPGPQVGKGRDVKYGMKHATGDIRLFTDADLATPLRHIETMIGLLENGSDIVIGSRELRRIHSSALRSSISRVANILIRIATGIYYQDTQCGFKGFTSTAAEKCFGKQTIMGWGFDVELLVIAKRNNLKVNEIAIPDWRDVDGGTLNDSVFSSTMRTLKELMVVRKNIRKGIYD